jgi:uncharacterized protein (DUF58 family)
MTRRGWAILGLSLVLWAAGRAFAIRELIQLSLGLSSLCLGAVLWVQLGRRRLQMVRSFSEVRVHRTEPTKLKIELANPDPLPTPPLAIKQELPFGGAIEAFLPPIHPKGTDVVAEPIRATRRGRYNLPPLEAVFTDPFGIASNVRRLSDECRLIVYPRVEKLPAMGSVGAAIQGTQTRRVPSNQGEDLFGVRGYEPGDDPRKVHWPATAKRGDLMVREEEAGARRTATVFIDTRANRFPDELAFESAVEAAASLIELYARSGYSLRLAHGSVGAKFGRGSLHYNQMLEELAIIGLTGGGGLGMRKLSSEYAEGVLNVVTGRVEAADVRLLSRTARRFQNVTVILTKGAAEDARLGSAAAMLSRAGVRVITRAPNQSLVDAWASSMAPTSAWLASARI